MYTSTIRLSSASPYTLSLTTVVSPALPAGDWAAEAQTVPAQGGMVPVLWFSRDDGISDDETWTFTTTFSVDGVAVSLVEQITVTETLPGSTMSQSMTAGATQQPLIDTNDPMSIAFRGVSGAQYSLAWTLPMSSDGINHDIDYTLTQTQPGYVSVPPIMTNIKTIVFLMLENRSFDSVLGWLHPGSDPSVFAGIPEGAHNDNDGAPCPVTQGTEMYKNPCLLPLSDPNEGLPHVKIQLYANDKGTLPEGDVWSQEPTMSGFAYDYAALAQVSCSEVMGAYDPTTLPVLSGLAAGFAVSDRWFSSAPTQTFPNRAFTVCGTSLGNEVNSEFSPSQFAQTNTLFNALGAAGKTWGLYWQSEDPFGSGVPGFTPFTSYMFPMIEAAANGGIYQYSSCTSQCSSFTSALAQGTLPNFCFIEPFWGGGATVDGSLVGLQGNDYHPPAWVGPAEASLNTLYENILTSPQWKANEMLLIITFDEHGGTWDHVHPTTASAPDGNVGASGFPFTRLGVRVPTILVSPYVTPGTVFQAPARSSMDFDHTSFIATLLRWAGIEPSSANLGIRVGEAPTFEGVFQTEVSSSKPPRFKVPDSYAGQGGGVGALLGLGGERLEVTRPINVVDLRRAQEECRTPEAFDARLRELVGAPARTVV